MAWEAWWAYMEWIRKKQKAVRKWMQPALGRAFTGWLENHEERLRNRGRMTYIIKRMTNFRLSKAFEGWLYAYTSPPRVHVAICISQTTRASCLCRPCPCYLQPLTALLPNSCLRQHQ